MINERSELLIQFVARIVSASSFQHTKVDQSPEFLIQFAIRMIIRGHTVFRLFEWCKRVVHHDGWSGVESE